MSTYCHPEFGCDCLDEIRSLEAEITMLRLRLEVNTSIAVGLMDNLEEAHRKCSGSSCTEECLRMTV